MLAGTVNTRAGSGNGEVWAVSGETTRGPSERRRLPRWMPQVVWVALVRSSGGDTTGLVLVALVSNRSK